MGIETLTETELVQTTYIDTENLMTIRTIYRIYMLGKNSRVFVTASRNINIEDTESI
jgi:hypothetical protein